MLQGRGANGLAVVALDAAPQGAEQGPYAGRLQAQVCQDARHLGLAGGRLDQARQDHLLKGPITTDRLTQPQARIYPVQNVPQQGRALGGHHRADVGRARGGWLWRWWRRGRSRASWSGAIRRRPISIRAASSAWVWAEPRCSMTLSRRPSLTAICTAIAPEAVLTLRRNGLTTPTLPAA